MAENTDNTEAKPAAEKPKTTRRTTAKSADTATAAEKKPASRTRKPKAEAEGKAATETAAKKPAARKTSAKAAEPEAGESSGVSTLKVHHLRPAPGARTAKTRVGRGEASKGKTAGRGTKGTKARYQVPERFEGGQMPMHMRLPKLRGFKNPFRTEYQVVNLDKLSMLYPAGGAVTVADLVAKGAVRKGQPVKILGGGEVSVTLQVSVDKVSASAAQKIVEAGGSVE